jgi:aspartate carbamoyltransferase regulatory subunit
MLIDELTQAVKKHTLWRGKIRSALIENDLNTVLLLLKNELQCEFCKWLYDKNTIREFEKVNCIDDYNVIKKIHSDIHKAINDIIKTANDCNIHQIFQLFTSDKELSDLFKELIDNIKLIIKKCLEVNYV